MAQSRNMKNAPLVFTLAHVEFSPVYSISEYIPKMQEHLRLEGYPLVHIAQMATMIPTAGPEMQKIAQEVVWEFKDQKSENGISITQNSVAIYTTSYIDFEEFSKRIKLVLDAIKNIVNPSLVVRTAVRYVDLIEVKEGRKFDYYLDDLLLGPFKSSLQYSYRSEAVKPTSLGYLCVRTLKDGSKNLLPPDLMDSPLAVKRGIPEGPYCFLDFDHVCPKQEEFAVQSIVQTIDDLHKETSKAFFKLTRKQAQTEWEAK